MDFLSQIPVIGPVLGWTIPFLIVLSVVVAIHELGHLMVGRWCGSGAARFFGTGKEERALASHLRSSSGNRRNAKQCADNEQDRRLEWRANDFRINLTGTCRPPAVIAVAALNECTFQSIIGHTGSALHTYPIPPLHQNRLPTLPINSTASHRITAAAAATQSILGKAEG